MTRAGWVCLALVAACTGGGSDVAREGDARYREGQFDLAVDAYRTALASGGRAEVWAKLGAAALAAGDAPAAVDAYEQLGLAEPGRVAEAARGLERALRVLARDGDSLGTAAVAVSALRRLSPDRPLGRVAATAAASGPGTAAPELLPAAVAGALAGADVDRLLLRAADALQATASCEPAVRVYRTLLRRAKAPGERTASMAGIGVCALWLGQDALASDRVADAERWFDTASHADTTGPVGLRARIGWGDARLRQGDLLGAALVWQAVRAFPGAPDSMVHLADERLQSLAAAPPGAERDPV
jgi:tetratricopeptide (TPR) repeat protein